MKTATKTTEPQLSKTTVEDALRGGLKPVVSKSKSNGVESIEELFNTLGKLSFAITNNKTAEKILKNKMYATPEGMKVKEIAEKKKRDNTEYNKVKNMLQGQLLMARKQKIEVPEAIKKSRLLTEGK